MVMALSPNNSGPLACASWSYADFGTADSVALATANTRVIWTGGTLDHLEEPGEYDSDTGLYTVKAGGIYLLRADVTFAATLAAGAEQTAAFYVAGSTSAYKRLKRQRVEGTNTTKVRVSMAGLTDYLAPETTIGLGFVSDTNSDTAEVFEASVVVFRMPANLGTAV